MRREPIYKENNDAMDYAHQFPVRKISGVMAKNAALARVNADLLHRIAELETQLEAIGAGGVSGQRITKKGEDK